MKKATVTLTTKELWEEVEDEIGDDKKITQQKD
jgi:hypothetical protein